MALNRSAVVTGAVAALPIVLPAVIVNAWQAGVDDPNGALVLKYGAGPFAAICAERSSGGRCAITATGSWPSSRRNGIRRSAIG